MKFFENFKFSNLFSKKKIDENLLDKFEELLIESDVGTQIEVLQIYEVSFHLSFFY